MIIIIIIIIIIILLLIFLRFPQKPAVGGYHFLHTHFCVSAMCFILILFIFIFFQFSRNVILTVVKKMFALSFQTLKLRFNCYCNYARYYNQCLVISIFTMEITFDNYILN